MRSNLARVPEDWAVYSRSIRAAEQLRAVTYSAWFLVFTRVRNTDCMAWHTVR